MAVAMASQNRKRSLVIMAQSSLAYHTNAGSSGTVAPIRGETTSTLQGQPWLEHPLGLAVRHGSIRRLPPTPFSGMCGHNRRAQSNVSSLIPSRRVDDL